MPDRCTMYAPPGGGDGEDPPDTFPDNWTPVESNVKCRLVSTIRSAAEREVAGSIREAAGAATPVAKQLAPGRTGALRASIFHHELAAARYEVGASAEYAVHVEYGTAYQDAQPFLHPAIELARREFERGLQNFFARLIG